MARDKNLTTAQGAAIDVLLGYCFKEIYTMGTAFPAGHMCNLAARTLVSMSGLSWPQYVSEHAAELSKADLSV